MTSVTVEMVVIAVTGSARHVATQWAMRKGGAGRQQAGGSAWLRQKSHRRNFDDSAQLASQVEEPKKVAHLDSRRTHFDALTNRVRAEHRS